MNGPDIMVTIPLSKFEEGIKAEDGYDNPTYGEE